jgi:tetratricopeptide (TPR) repeat protein
MKQAQRIQNWLISRAVPIVGLLVLILIGAGIYTLVQSFTEGGLYDSAPPQLSTRSNGRPIQAIYRIELLANRDGWTDELHRQAGQLSYEIGDLRNAVAHWEAANFSDSVSLQYLAQAYIELQRWDSAQATIERILALNPEDQWAKYQYGLLIAAFDPLKAEPYLLDSARVPGYSDAAGAVLHVVLNDTNNPLISMNVGLALADNRLWAYAERAFTHAAILGDPYPEALAYTGLAREQQGKDGSVWIDQAVALGGATPQARFVKGLQLRSKGQYQESLREFADAVALDPANPAYYAELGSAYRLLFNYEQAEHWLRTAVAVSDNDPRFQRLLAVFYAEEGYRLTDLDADSLHQLSGVVPNDPDILAGFGWALHTMGDTAGGLAEIETALSLAPDNPQALYNKARIFVETGKPEEALPLLQRVVVSNSEYTEPAQQVLDLLQAGAPEATAEPSPDSN